MDRSEAALRLLCALISNESVISRPPGADSGEADHLVASAFVLVDALEAGAYTYEDEDAAEPVETVVETADPEPEADAADEDEDAAE